MDRRFQFLMLLLAVIPGMVSHTRAQPRHDPSVSAKLYPVDEGYKNPSFAEFRERLEAAVARRDTAFFLDCVSEDIALGPNKLALKAWSSRRDVKSVRRNSAKAQSSYSYLDSVDLHRRGKRRFIADWFEYRAPTACPTTFSAPIWNRVEKILRLGGTFANAELTVFRAPYLWPLWPWDGDYDFAIVDSNVVMEPMKSYGEPDTASCDSLSYDLVRLVFYEIMVGGTPDPLVLVETADGRCGYVLREKLRNPVDFGMEFTYRDGRWRITRFSEYP